MHLISKYGCTETKCDRQVDKKKQKFYEILNKKIIFNIKNASYELLYHTAIIQVTIYR